MKKIKAKRKVSKFRSGIKKLTRIVIAIGVLAVAGTSVYAFATYKTQTANGSEIDRLTAIVQEYKTQDNEVVDIGVVKIIQRVCEEEGFDVDLAMRVASCESYLRRYFVHVNNDGSLDRGVFALNSGYYGHITNECSFDVECATKVFVQQAKAGKINDWLCYKRVK